MITYHTFWHINYAIVYVFLMFFLSFFFFFAFCLCFFLSLFFFRFFFCLFTFCLFILFLDIADGQRRNHARRIFPKSRALGVEGPFFSSVFFITRVPPGFLFCWSGLFRKKIECVETTLLGMKYCCLCFWACVSGRRISRIFWTTRNSRFLQVR